ncbi:DUF7255 family protein [Marivirga arenosa]|uniref:Uncharacterized protein n=1 Tax=Marivirga arenosa TaxID=3059076 RepID=A0AA51N4Y5_9BACT|nr:MULTISPECIES: hypothetical protein [unclassified Marivirga]WMN06386.1 hypothetical protein QYS48_32400 [Marivirga sp. ABR2-2]WNB17273.1 hypothetical protein QYS47_33445 [Marivirga sp. BKB1-2]
MNQMNIEQSSLISQLQQYLENVEVRTDFELQEISVNKLYEHHGEEFEELADDLDFSLKDLLNKDLKFKFELLNLQPSNMNLFLDPEYHFNRYRLKTLRNIIYDKIPFMDIQKWRSYCRSKEKEAYKGGLVKGIWDHKLAKDIFGNSEEPGYFGDNGSSGWKLIAIANYCLDLYSKDQNLQFIRLCPYDSFMSNGQIELLGNSLKLRKNEKAIQKMLSRKIGFPLPNENDKKEDE